VLSFDELVKSRPEALFVNYHEGHEEHEAEIITYFFPFVFFVPFVVKIRLFTIA